MNDQSREEFEAWAMSLGINLCRQSMYQDKYAFNQRAWESWQASEARSAEKIRILEQQIISGFYEDRVPQFEQGSPRHELQDVVTAEEVTRYVTGIEQRDEKIRLLLETIEEMRRAIGDHNIPTDCYSTGPLTGNVMRDLMDRGRGTYED
jgi:hypothetical protein